MGEEETMRGDGGGGRGVLMSVVAQTDMGVSSGSPLSL